MQGAFEHGFITTVTHPDGRAGGLLDLRCQSREVSASAGFRDLARAVCQVLADHTPQYLGRDRIPPSESERILGECRVEALRRGIPDEDREAYAAQLAARRTAGLCLLELPLGAGTVGQALEDFGHPVLVRRFYRASLDD